MKVLIFFLMLIVIVATIFFIPTSRAYVESTFSTSVCDTPIQYKLGSIDSRFGLSQATIMADIQQATGIWSSAEHKQLFVYNPKASLSVEFVYDQRQQLDSQIQQMEQQLDTNNQDLNQQISTYYKEQNDFRQKLDALNTEIESWNQKGGAPQDVYQQLNQQQQALQQEADQLNAKAKDLNLSTNDYNSQVGVLNQDVNQFNTALSQKPEEGLYDPNNQTITVYFATNHDELVHTLTHEFGHSLGMVHEDDPKAIMYPDTTKTITLAQEDLTQLQSICRQQSVFIIWNQRLESLFRQEIQNFQQKHSPASSS